jgi:hypothetical protein
MNNIEKIISILKKKRKSSIWFVQIKYGDESVVKLF